MRRGGRIFYDRAGLTLLAVLFLVGVALVTLLPAARIDLTENRLYTLSEGTLKIVGNIPEPVNVYLFFSDKASASLPQLRTYAGRVREMLEEFASHSEGKLNVRLIDPLPFSEEEDRATAFGLRPINPNDAEPVYFGIAATNSVGDDETIPFLEPSKETFLEYDLARLVYSLAHPKKPVVGLLSTLPMTAGFDPMTQQIRQPWVVADQLRQLFDLRTLEPGLARVDDDIQVLMLVHPKDLPEPALYAIDQFILRGGHALIFADPHAEMDPGDPADPMGGFGAGPRASDLGKLLTAWGIDLDTSTVVGDDRYALPVSGPHGAPVRHLGIIGVTADGMSQDDVVTSGLNVLNLAFAGHITRKESAPAQLTPILWSSNKAALVPAGDIALASDPDALRDDFSPTGEHYTLAARITGTVPSAFPADGRPDHLAGSAQPINVLLVADTDLLSDRLWAQAQEFLGQRLITTFANNGDLAINALDNLLGSSDLISIRSRATFQRPFTRVQELRREAELRFRAAEERLQAELQETDARLSELQASRTDQGTGILSPQQEAEIERFQARRLELRKELRQVQRELDRDIERLGTRLKLLNVAVVPLAVSVASILLVVVRRRRRRQPEAAA